MGYIADYLKTTENTEPCNDYHIWSMLMTLSVFAGRRFWLPFGPYTYYTHLYVVLVGDAGSCKSSAMDRAKNIVRATGICPVAASQITKEALMQKMSSTVDGKAKKVAYDGQKFFEHEGKRVEYNQYSIFATELTQFIGVNPLGWIEFLTAVWTEPIVEVDTKHQGHDFVVGPYITMQACMTPDVAKGYIRSNILASGFARRAAFVYDSGPKIVPIPEFTSEQEAAELRCIQFGRDLQKRSGPFICTPECWEFYKEWYVQNKTTLLDKPPTVQSWYRSKAEMLFKLSMLVALAESNELVITLPVYKLAMTFCESMERRMTRVFEGIGVNPNSQAAVQICRMLEAMPVPMNKKDVLGMFFDQATSINELKDTISHLVNVGRLAERTLQANNILLGTVIGCPASIAGRTDVELALFLVPRGMPRHESGMDLSSEERPPEQPQGLHVDRNGDEDSERTGLDTTSVAATLPSPVRATTTPPNPLPD